MSETRPASPFTRSSQASQPVKVVPDPAILPAFQRVLAKLDLLSALAIILETREDYGTLAAFALVNRTVHTVVQPVLAKIKKRIVLVIEDYRWRNPANDGNIR